MITSRITHIAIEVPQKIITNYDLEKMVDTSDEWIVTRTGIKQRRIVNPDESSSTLGAKAAKKLLSSANINKDEIDLIVVATATPDMLFPSTACLIQKELNSNNKIPAFDIEAGCCGFLYGLSICDAFIKSGYYKKILLIGVEVLSKLVDWTDRNTCVLFGDGAGAVLIEPDTNGYGILSSYLWADGNFSSLIELPAGGTRLPASYETIDKRLHYIKMNGKEVFKQAVKVMAEGVKIVLEKCNLSIDDVSLIIPHQANIRIIQALAEKLNFPIEKVYVNIEKYGNTSAASIIIALYEAIEENKLKKGDVVVLTSFGVGLTMASICMRL
jgi:3-oxoacyl-[acyl-carrier-protein] synthase-3